MSAIGVNTGWEIQDEPELISMSTSDMPFVQVRDTGTNLGKLGGYFKGDAKINLRRTFTPEHGLIYTVAVFKIEQFMTEASIPCAAHTLPEHYWSPEYDTIKQRGYPQSLWLPTATAGENVESLPNFEHLRKGSTLTTLDATGVGGYTYSVDPTLVSQYKVNGGSNWDAAFEDDIGFIPDSDVTYAAAALMSKTALRKLSPGRS